MCKCDCGKTIEVPSRYLLNGHVSSCGCLKESVGELKIKSLLNINKINFIYQYHTESCRYPDTNYLAYFDFYVEGKYIIEFDGIQHFKPFCFNMTSQEKAEQQFLKTQQHDLFKNKWCKDNNIPLIRIPYTHLNKLTIEDLKLETSKFLV